MQSLLAIAVLTWKAAFRFRLFLVLAVLLLAAVVGLPILVKDDGTAQGFTQVLLTYTLSAITALLGLSTLWLACGTLARDVEDCTIQMVVVKPVARWQIWLGKWLGIMSLNAALLALTGGCVFGLLQWRAGKLPLAEQQILRSEVLVARGHIRPEDPSQEIEEMTEARLAEKLRQHPDFAGNSNVVRNQVREGVKAEFQLAPPGATMVWPIDLGLAKHSVRDQPLRVRFKFNASTNSPSGTFVGVWAAGVPETARGWASQSMSLAPDTFHEFEIPPNLFDDKGLMTIAFRNLNDATLLFPLQDGIEILYREGGFALNFARGLCVIFCWMALLAALGLAAASFLSFPVAAFVSLAALLMAFSTGTMSGVVEQGSILGWDEEGKNYATSSLDFIAVPAFKTVLSVINLAKGFSPIDALSTGQSITWLELGRAVAQIVLLLGGILAIFGIWTFSRRELATAQGNQ